VYSIAKKDRYNSKIYTSGSASELIDEYLYEQPVTNPVDVLIKEEVKKVEVAVKYFEKCGIVVVHRRRSYTHCV